MIMNFKLPLLFRLRRALEKYFQQKIKNKYLPAGKNSLDSQQAGISGGWADILVFLYEQGIVSEPGLKQVLPNDEWPGFFCYYLPAKLSRPLTDGHESDSFNQGSSFVSVNDAIARAVGELLERYALGLYKNEKCFFASVGALKKGKMSFLSPKKISQFSDEQKKRDRRFMFDDDAVFQWVWGRSLLSNKPILIPAQTVFWNYCHHAKNEPYLIEPNTNGAAGMFSRETALAAGLLELIQRDAFLIYWLNKAAPRRVDLETLSQGALKDSVKSLEEKKCRVFLFDLVSDFGLPICVAAIIKENDYPYLAIGGGCDFNAQKAAISALEEAFAASYILKIQSVVAGQRQIKRDRLLFWSKSQNFPRAKFFFEGESEPFEIFGRRSIAVGGDKERLEYLTSLFKAKGEGYEPYFYEAQHPVLKSLGYCAVRAIAPALAPFYLLEANMPLGAKRLRQAPNVLGFGAAKDFNDCPHFFP